MATLAETETYEAGIYQLEITDPVIGGPDGIDNLQAKQLANRTNWLKAKIDSLLGLSVIHAATLKATPADADEFGFLSSTAAWSLVKMTGTNLKAWLKTYFDVVYIQPSQLFGSKNKIINGLLNINQRAVAGTVVLTAGQYGHDRYKAGVSGCTYTFATVANVTTITITAGSLIQVVEGLNLQSGVHTLSWVGTSQCKIDAGAYSNSGITGTLTGGTNATIEIGIGTFTKLQLEFGSIATPFENRPYGLELSLCKRYYEKSSHTHQGTYPPSSATAFTQWDFEVEKRILPTIVQANGSNLTLSAIGVSGICGYSPASTYPMLMAGSTASAEL